MKRIFVPTHGEQDWQPHLAKPQLHWKRGRSAMTLAVSWENAASGIPTEIRESLDSCGQTKLADLEVMAAFPEYSVALDGGVTASQTDLMVVARNALGLVVLAIEGKVDESAGPTIDEKLGEGAQGFQDRLKSLKRILGLDATPAGKIRYQFLHRLVSAVKTARDYHAGAAVMVVHSFSKGGAGYADFEDFCREVKIEPGKNVVLRYPHIADPDVYILWSVGDLSLCEVDVNHGAGLNLFSSTQKLTQQREDHLTEFVAGGLAISPQFRDAYARLVIGGHARKANWAPPRIRRIQTQVQYSEGRDIPDLILELADGHVVAVEHKIDAKEGEAKADSQPSQLRRYLGLEQVDALAYFRASRANIDPDILGHPKYCRPEKGETHFTWRDLYPLLEAQGGWYFRWLAEAFNGMGFRPAVAKLGSWSSEEDRRNFALFWKGVRSVAEESYGWRTSPGSIVELYFERSPRSIAETIWINPQEFAVLKVRITPRPGLLDEVASAIASVASTIQYPMDVEVTQVTRSAGSVKVVDATMSLATILAGRLSTSEHFESRLKQALEPLLKALHR